MMQKPQKHLHVIGIGGIGVSALARYYKHLGYSVSGSDGADSPFLDILRSEGFEIFIGHRAENLRDNTDLLIYSEAIITKPDLTPEEQIYSNPELAKAQDLDIRHISYPVALGEVFNAKQGIAITGSHGKSTTTAMTGIVLAHAVNSEQGTVSSIGASVLVGTQVPQFENSNFHFEVSENFVIEACEYKRSFLQYRPYITVITNIDLDHLDYYKNLEDYISAFQSLVDQTSGYVIISADDENSRKLHIPEAKKIVVGSGRIQYSRKIETLCHCGTEVTHEVNTLDLPSLSLQVPGEHLLQDAYLAYTVGRLLEMDDEDIIERLESYRGSWRRSEIVKTTEHGNILMSDYGHHPNEIRPTLRAIREKYVDKKLFVVFQPHQYSRTRELLAEFATSFDDADTLIIPNIYFSRDKQEDVEWMSMERLVTLIKSEKGKTKNGFEEMVMNGNGLANTLTLIQKYDNENPDSSVILLLGAGDVDGLRYEIE